MDKNDNLYHSNKKASDQYKFGLFKDEEELRKVIAENLKKKPLPESDHLQYVTDYDDYMRGVAAYNQKLRHEGIEDAMNELLEKYGPTTFVLTKIEQNRQRMEEERLQLFSQLKPNS